MGKASRDAGNSFEKQIEGTFAPYVKAGIAKMDRMPVPMAPCGIRHPKTQAPLYRPASRPPFDIYGWTMRFGTFIGAELKSTERRDTLPIVMPKLVAGNLVTGKGSGLKFHQLDCLNSVAASGGFAKLVWMNGGEIGVLNEDAIRDAYTVAWENWQAGLRGLDTPLRGTRSIPWTRFSPVSHRVVGGVLIPDWLGV